MSETTEHVLIIGSGPAGYTAAIYAARANLSPLMIEGYFSGGQLMLTTEVENYPGFPDGVMGPDFILALRKQAERFGTRMITKDVTAVNLREQPLRIEVESDIFHALTVIVSTGASAKLLDLPSESRLMGHGVSTCATCDGAFFRGKDVAVVGGGDSAMEEANFLTRFASKVYVIHRREQLRASKIMQDRAFANPKIEFVWNAEVRDILGQESVSGMRLQNNQNNEFSDLECQGVFVAIGHQPNTQLFAGQLEMDEIGYLRIQHPSSRTNIPGVFAAGDVHDPHYRQAITAAGSGCRAAMDAERYLEALGY